MKREYIKSFEKFKVGESQKSDNDKAYNDTNSDKEESDFESVEPKVRKVEEAENDNGLGISKKKILSQE